MPGSMSPQDARLLLDAHAPEGEPWPWHCRQVARVAVRLGEALQQAGAPVDLAELEVQALLHDIGRSLTHGPFHGWSGFVLLRSLGRSEAGRGCLTHWLKGRAPEELRQSTHFRDSFIERVYAAIDPPGWTLADSVLSVADSSVRHSTVVGFEERYRDLYQRYGQSAWLERACELTSEHAGEIAGLLGRPVEDVLEPLYGDTLE